MGTGIIICGLNGVGKSTLGKALAEKLKLHFIDNEDLYFPKTDPERPYSCFQYDVLIQVPRQIRLQRVRDRSFQRFGPRMLPGGDLHDSEEHFFQLVESRPENTVEEWARSLSCPVIRVDGTISGAENISLIAEHLAPEHPVQNKKC